MRSFGWSCGAGAGGCNVVVRVKTLAGLSLCLEEPERSPESELLQLLP